MEDVKYGWEEKRVNKYWYIDINGMLECMHDQIVT